jgi:hypothetical protein
MVALPDRGERMDIDENAPGITRDEIVIRAPIVRIVQTR